MPHVPEAYRTQQLTEIQAPFPTDSPSASPSPPLSPRPAVFPVLSYEVSLNNLLPWQLAEELAQAQSKPRAVTTTDAHNPDPTAQADLPAQDEGDS